MDALDLLLNRRSIARLTSPAPEGAALENIIQAGLRAPDHGGLTPWRFVIAQGEGLNKLGAILAQAAVESGSDDIAVKKATNAPHRAPMVITVIAKVSEHPKVPAIEQHLSAGCAVQAMQMAAVAQGFQGIWRSGPLMFHSHVHQAFNLQGEDQIVGFLYLGTPDCTPMKAPTRDLAKFVEFL
ncbi:NAD(P)H nitroreductase [Vibrio sp. SCSIO 43136]|uniref:NAD(P)H nitroreductase n=1 Tax=Vibrio sp. SCSIO 43136 TaxID=2819101 RepID=UPI002075BDE2|nr:NAD(P)H nitroreductase [Vibrio sp. SCSIO 43136]USD66061.1 NAD(P)H nitroreductase [Vibrio sp. SCSIO 43136]